MGDIWSEVRNVFLREQEAWPVELRFLCHPLSQPGIPETQEGVEKRPILDWDAFITLLRRHRLLPLAPCYLHRYREVMPAAAATRLRQSWQHSRLQSLARSGELASLLTGFQSDAIRILPLKGPLLAQELFGDPTARLSKDLDLLAHPEDLGRAAERLSAQGYLSTDGYPDFSPRQRQAFFSQYHHFGFWHPQRAIRIELHWRWFDNPLYFSLPLEDSLFRSRQSVMGGVVMPTLGPKETLLYLCAHGARHLWHRLSWIRDIAAILASPEPVLDWPKMLAKAQGLGVRTALIEGTALASLLYRYQIPEPMKAVIHQAPSLPNRLKTVCWVISQPSTPKVKLLNNPHPGPAQ
jgi:hypothetical protein